MQIYRFSGLIAILGVVSILVGLVAMVLLLGLKYAAWGLLLLGVGLLAIAFIIDYKKVGSALGSKRGKFSAGTTVMTSIFIGITLLVNAISIGNYQRFDITGVAQFTLTSQTKDVLSDLEIPVKVLAFFTPDDPFGIASYAGSLLTEYQNYTSQLEVEIIDPDERPDQARQYDIVQYQSVVFETEKGRRLVSPQDMVKVSIDQQGNQQIAGLEAEHAFTSAILEVTGNVQKKVYFLTGHGESDISLGYSQVRQRLLDNLYKVGTLDLVRELTIPGDAAALIIAGAQKSLTSREVDVIQQYLEDGGWVMVLANPGSPTEIKQLLSNWGISLENGTMIDLTSYVTPSIDNILITRTSNYLGLPTIYFPGATAIIPSPGFTPSLTMTETGLSQLVSWTSQNSSLQMTQLVWTGANSWLESSFTSSASPEFNDGIDKKGPLPLALLVTDSAAQQGTGPRLLVLGDSDFALNQHFVNGNNGEFFLNGVNLLTAGKQLITIERKVLPFRRLVVGPDEERFINFTSIGLLPLLLLVAGGIVWWRRR